MRKLKLQVQMTVNGFIAGLNSEMDWMTFQWDDTLKEFVTELTQAVDTILLGRNMADGFITHWNGVAEDPDNPEYESGKKYSETHKVVFSKTLSESEWENTAIASGELIDEVTKLKSQEGGDLIVYGGASFVSSLIENDLIDDYYIFINPVSIKDGLTIFGNRDRMDLVLQDVKSYDCGIVVLHYSRD